MYVLICHGNGKNDGRYVASPGSEHSYTADIRKAQQFATREDAERNKCGNESVVSVESQMQG